MQQSKTYDGYRLFCVVCYFLQTNFDFVHPLLSLKFGAYAYYVRSYTNIYKLMLRNNIRQYIRSYTEAQGNI